MGRRLKQAAQVVALLLVAGLFALLGWKVTHQGGGQQLLDKAAKGAKPLAPDFRLARLDGDGHLDLRTLRHKVVVLNFWASWCDPCKREMPQLERAYRAYRDRGVVFVGVDAQDFKSSARAQVKKFGTSYPVLYDGSGSVLDRYGGMGLPKTFLIDRRGRVLDVHLGALQSADIDGLLNTALKPA